MRPGPLRGEPFAAFVAPARARPALWRLGLGLALIAICWILAAILTMGVATGLGAAPGGATATMAALLSFAGMTLGAGLAARLLGRRGWRTLIGPDGFRPRAFAAGAAASVALFGVYTLFAPWYEADIRISPAEWLLLLPVALIAILIQTSAEEIVFRGYLTQGLAARFRAPAVWLVVPALLFGALHWDPASLGANASYTVATAAVIGLVFADVTARTGNLSAAMGLHFANNAVAMLLVARSDPFGGFALYAGPDSEDPALLRAALMTNIALWLAGYGLWLAWNHRRPRG